MILNDDLTTITESDLDSLIQNEVLEGKTLEYKREVPLVTKDNKQKFLAGISSFANASGGDYIIGIEVDPESKIPKSLIGVPISDRPIDEIMRGLDDLIRQRIQPRILDCSIHPVKLKNFNYAIIIRIKKSWIGPHRITIEGCEKFYTRGAAATITMDVSQLRSAFLLSETRIEKIKSFILERISDIYSMETPIPLNKGAKVVLHIIPFTAFEPERIISLDKNEKEIFKLITLDRFRLSIEYNLNGIIKSGNRVQNQYSDEYIQFFRNGIIESVSASYFVSHKDEKCILIYLFEEGLIKAVDNNLNVLKNLFIEPPFLIQISLTNIRGYKMCKPQNFFEDPREIYKDIIQLPEIIIENFENSPDKILHNAFDALSNACGLPKSLNYDDEGNWVSK